MSDKRAQDGLGEGLTVENSFVFVLCDMELEKGILKQWQTGTRNPSGISDKGGRSAIIAAAFWCLYLISAQNQAMLFRSHQ